MALTQVSTGGIKNATIKNEDIEADTVQLTKLQNMATNHILGRSTSGTGNPEIIGAAQTRTILNVADGANQTTINNNADNRLITGSGTANTLEGESTTFDGTILKFSATNTQIELQTSDGSDTGFLNFSGGGACSQGRGAQIVLYGNEASSNEGTLYLLSGQSGGANSKILFYTSGSEKAVLDLNGNLGLGVTSPSAKLDVFRSNDNTTACEITNNGTTGGHGLKISSGGTGSGTKVLSVHKDNQSGNAEVFRVDGGGTKFLDSTNDTTANNERKSYFTSNGQQYHGRNAHETYIVFQDVSNSQIGGITRGSGSSVAYNTSSDYRLKENVTGISDGITRLKTLKPSRFNFKSEPSITMDGFLAHEVTAVPEAIEGEKDGVITQAMLDAGTLQGSVGDPIYQQIDQSKLVPLLVAAVQELIAKVETLETA